MIKSYELENQMRIMAHAENAKGKSFNELIIEEDEIVEAMLERARTNKGFNGNLLQYAYFGIKQNSDKEPDFKAAEIELKATGYRRKKDLSLVADQRLVLSSLNFEDYIDEKCFEESSLMQKCAKILMMFYLVEDGVSKLDYTVNYVRLYEILKIYVKDLEVIKHDYYNITKKISQGKACEISEGDTAYLCACRRDGKEVDYYIDGKKYKALPRRFALKTTYITYLLNQYIDSNIDFSKSIQGKEKSDIKIPRGRTFEEYVEKMVSKYIGRKAQDIAKQKNINYVDFLNSNDKAKYARLSFRMFGIRSNEVSYLQKSGISIKSIRIDRNNYIKQNVSFPTFQFKEIVQENNWVESGTYQYLSERRFLFIIYKENVKGEYVLKGYQFLSMSADVLDDYFKPVWEKVKKVIADGFEIQELLRGKKVIYTNSLPGIGEKDEKGNPYICHIRPHSGQIAYKLKDGRVIGDIEKYANELPDGQWMTTQSFWLNNTYLMNNLDKRFFT